MKKRSVRRLLSWFLVIALSLIPLQSQASAETALNNEAESIASRLTSLAELDTIMTEELSMREESVKVYSIGSNGYIAAVYNESPSTIRTRPVSGGRSTTASPP